MTTAIVGVGNIGSAVARHLVAGGEPVILAAKDESAPKRLRKISGRSRGPPRWKTRSAPPTLSSSPCGST